MPYRQFVIALKTHKMRFVDDRVRRKSLLSLASTRAFIAIPAGMAMADTGSKQGLGGQ